MSNVLQEFQEQSQRIDSGIRYPDLRSLGRSVRRGQFVVSLHGVAMFKQASKRLARVKASLEAMRDTEVALSSICRSYLMLCRVAQCQTSKQRLEHSLRVVFVLHGGRDASLVNRHRCP